MVESSDGPGNGGVLPSSLSQTDMTGLEMFCLKIINIILLSTESQYAGQADTFGPELGFTDQRETSERLG